MTREEVEQYLTALGQAWREDESNLDHRFARNRVRHELLPLLEREYNPNIRQVLSDAAEVSRAEEEYWQALVERELQDRLVLAAEPEAHTGGKRMPSGLKPARDDKLEGPAARLKPCPFKAASQSHASASITFQVFRSRLQRRLLKRLARVPTNPCRLRTHQEAAALRPRRATAGGTSRRMAGGTPTVSAWNCGPRSRIADLRLRVQLADSGRGPHRRTGADGASTPGAAGVRKGRQHS